MKNDWEKKATFSAYPQGLVTIQVNILSMNRLNKLTIFHTFILSNFNFCPLAWHFCTNKNSKKLEKVQERALHFVYEDYNSSYEELLQKAKVPSLQIRRMRTMALETYKIINKLAPVCLHDLVHMKNSKYSFRYSNILEIPQIKSTRYGKKSFRFAAPTLWNSLPDHFRTENSFSQFKSLLQSWNGSKCRCSACRWLKFCFWFAYILIFYFLFLNYLKIFSLAWTFYILWFFS